MCQAHYGDIKCHKHNMNLIWGIKSYNFYLIFKLGFQVSQLSLIAVTFLELIFKFRVNLIRCYIRHFSTYNKNQRGKTDKDKHPRRRSFVISFVMKVSYRQKTNKKLKDQEYKWENSFVKDNITDVKEKRTGNHSL